MKGKNYFFEFRAENFIANTPQHVGQDAKKISFLPSKLSAQRRCKVWYRISPPGGAISRSSSLGHLRNIPWKFERSSFRNKKVDVPLVAKIGTSGRQLSKFKLPGPSRFQRRKRFVSTCRNGRIRKRPASACRLASAEMAGKGTFLSPCRLDTWMCLDFRFFAVVSTIDAGFGGLWKCLI